MTDRAAHCRGCAIAQPVHLVFIGAAAERDLAWQVRALIEIGAGASVRWSSIMSAREQMCISATWSRNTYLQAGAGLDLVQIQDAAETA